jgi:hypothetical protein
MNKKFNYIKLIALLTKHMLDNGMNIRPLPKIKFVHNNKNNANNFFGKTAYYDPDKKVIVLFTMDRHPKDIMRSFAHEMVHHEQNCNGQIHDVETEDTNEDGDLAELESVAFERGNMMFRNWTDSITENKKEQKQMEEMTMCDACAKAMLEDIQDGVIKTDITEAEYRGRKVKLNKPMRGDVKKFKVYVKDPKTGNIKKVNFGHGGTSAKRAGQKTMRIRKNNPKARKSFRARHNCKNPGPKTKARYWSCKKW